MKAKFTLHFIAVLFISVFVFVTAHAQRRLCVLGDASRYGWDKENASPMIQDPGNVSVFHYNGWLKVGEMKFILENQNDWVPTWNKGVNDTTLVKRLTYGDPDDKFYIATAGNYEITLDTTLLYIHITPMTEPNPIDFNTVFMVGSASPNGWSINNSTELVKNPSNPWEFSYTGQMGVGEFKFPVNRNQFWSQDFFMRVSDQLMFLGKSPDSKWNITEAGNYFVTMNISTLAIGIHHLPENAGTITGASTVCQGQNQVIYSVPTIPYATFYIWTLPTGATGTSLTNSITVDFGTQAATGNISVTGSNMYGSGSPSSLGITVNPLPGVAGAITGLATVTQGQGPVVYRIPPIPHADSYTWTLPAGASGSSTSDTIAVTYSMSAASGSITVYASNNCGNGIASAPFNVTVTPAVPLNLTVSDVLIKNGQSVCYNALNTVTIAGDGNNFIVANTGSAHVIAGSKILLEPGTYVFEGGYFHGIITTNGTFCTLSKSLVASISADDNDLEASPQQDKTNGALSAFIYPNPTCGKLILEFRDNSDLVATQVKLFGPGGVMLFNKTVFIDGKYEISLENYKPGLYLLSCIWDSKTDIFKIIRK